MRNVVERAGLVPRGTDVWGTSPTRSHEVLVMREEDRWVAMSDDEYMAELERIRERMERRQVLKVVGGR